MSSKPKYCAIPYSPVSVPPASTAVSQMVSPPRATTTSVPAHRTA